MRYQIYKINDTLITISQKKDLKVNGLVQMYYTNSEGSIRKRKTVMRFINLIGGLEQAVSRARAVRENLPPSLCIRPGFLLSAFM